MNDKSSDKTNFNPIYKLFETKEFNNSKLLSIDQLETYFKNNLEEIELDLNDLIKFENNLNYIEQMKKSSNQLVIDNKNLFKDINNQLINNFKNQTSINSSRSNDSQSISLINSNSELINKSSINQTNQCLKKSSKSKFLAKRNRLKMNKEILISNNINNSISNISNANKWNGQTSLGSSPILLSPCSSTSEECATSSVEMRLSNLGSSLSNYSLCSRSSANEEENDLCEQKMQQDQTVDYYEDDEDEINYEMDNKKCNDKQNYDLFEITRSMPSLDLIESINNHSLPRFFKEFDKQYSQPKLSNFNQPDYYHNSSQNKSTTNQNQVNDSVIDSQKLIKTRFGFIKNVPAAKNLILNNSSSYLNENESKDEFSAQSVINKERLMLIKEQNIINERLTINEENLIRHQSNKITSISSMDLSNKQINEQLINLPKPFNQRSLSALTINCDTNKLNSKQLKFLCPVCSSNLCKCKLKANSLLAVNQSSKPKLAKKPYLEVSHFIKQQLSFIIQLKCSK